MPRSSDQRREIYFSGRVQGVGFRQTTYTLASDFDVCGYVRNLSDGRVELIVEGAADEIDRFTSAVENRMARYIDGATVRNAAATGEFTAFDVRF